MLAEYFEHLEEAVWATEAIRMATGMVVATNLCIGPEGDLHGATCEEVALKLVDAGAKIVGLNCHFDPFVQLKGMEKMKNALEKHNINDVHLMIQPLA